MIVTTEQVDRSLTRLATDQDFKTLIQWLEEEKQQRIDRLIAASNTVTVHQLQGEALVLTDILEAAMSSSERVAAKARARNT